MIEERFDKSAVRLDERLAAVILEIQRFHPASHADIGTDHGYLPAALHRARICTRLIATELSDYEYRKAKDALRHLPDIAVLQGDGLAPLLTRPVECLSICGMGGRKIASILEGHPSAVPDRVILQPNRDAERLRRWALDSGFHIRSERLISGRFLYPILSFVRSDGPDQGYRDLPERLALRFGPLLLGRRDPLLLADIAHRWSRYSRLPDSRERRLLELVLELLQTTEGPGSKLKAEAASEDL